MNLDYKDILLKDRFRLRRLWQQEASLRSAGKLDQAEKKRKAFERLHESSVEQMHLRQSIELTITYPESLPVTQEKAAIIEAITSHQVVVIAGETGSGKTTQLGKILLEMGYGRKAMIAHTQPRRVAASSVSTRIAEELNVSLGEEVGYQIRFTDHSSEKTLLKVMTDGVLLAEIQNDRFLEKYDAIIIDEAHERSLNIDFLLGYLKQLLDKRKDLKLIITSATIDLERFSQHFNNAPVVEVSGRTYPVECLYSPIEDLSDDKNLPEAILRTLEDIELAEREKGVSEKLGDVLVFLPGESEIRQTSLLLRKSQLNQTEVLPLYSRLSQAEQKKIFHVSNRKQGRRVILATNVAETSLTVPGIRYVIDSGLARISRYSHRSKIQRLPVEKISQASANQRAGRCGRIGPGICYRLFSEEDFKLREAFTEPEIQRTNLASVILQMLSMGLGDIFNFPFIQSPDKRLINDGFKQLVDLGAVDDKRRLSQVGRKLAQLPLDPKLSRILVEADREGSLKEVVTIVSALSIQDPRENPADKKEASREKHSRFKDEKSDFMGLLNLWEYAEEQRQDLSQNQFRKLCSREFLSWQRLKEWREVHHQLMQICRELKLRINKETASYDSVHRALLAGFVTQIGFQSDKKVYDGTRNRQFQVFPGSYLYKKPPKWLMAAELIETSKLYSHVNAMIDPAWVRDLASHLLKFTYLEPHFNPKQGQVMAYEKASLYGLVISEKRKVSFGKIDPELSRKIFIRSGLVEERLAIKAGFYLHNKKLRKDLLKIEEKTRRRDLLENDEAVFRFYDERIPQNITNLAAFEKWRKKAEKDQPKLLYANQAVYLSNDLGAYQKAQFPDSIDWDGVTYKLSYRFEPGHPEDGVSVHLPMAALNRVPKFYFEWLVPGLLAEKCEALLKSLPKQYRRSLVPIPDTVKQIMPALEPNDIALAEALSRAIKQKHNITIPIDAWAPEKLDSYYKMNYKLYDEDGRFLMQSRELADITKSHGHKVQEVLDKAVSVSNEEKKTEEWIFGDIETTQILKKSGSTIKAYPAVKDHGDGVSLTLVDNPFVQSEVHRNGLVRMAMLKQKQQVKYLKKELLKGNELQLKMTANFDKNKIREDLIHTIFNHTFFNSELPYTESCFNNAIEKHRSELVAKAQKLEALLIDIIHSDYSACSSLGRLPEKGFEMVIADVKRQRERLLFPGFLYQTPAEYLYELPRYFKALALRLERIQGQLNKDLAATHELTVFDDQLLELAQECPGAELMPSAVQYRWMIEEYRVSLFAQHLKTKMPISKKRLDKQWELVLNDRRSNFL